jgi:hypothetical protein
MMIAFFQTSSIRSIGLYLTYWTGSYEEQFRLRPSRCTRGSFDFSCHKHGNLATMLVFFNNWLDPLDWVMSNLLDGFLLRATTTTSRVTAPGAVSTT